MSKHTSGTIFCSNASCPRPYEIELPRNAALSLTANLLALDRHEAFQDVSGNYWCQQCQWRGALMNWGKSHNWPALTCFPYAVARGEQFWKAAIMLGDDSYAQALYDAIQIAEEV